MQHDAGHLKVADFGLGKLIDPLAADSDALYEMTGETGSCKPMSLTWIKFIFNFSDYFPFTVPGWFMMLDQILFLQLQISWFIRKLNFIQLRVVIPLVP